MLSGVVLLAAGIGEQSRVLAAGPHTSATASESAERVDLNTAPAAQLRDLPGMGDAYVRRIVEGRPYTAKNQLLTRGVLPQTAYEAIREFVVAHHALRQP